MIERRLMKSPRFFTSLVLLAVILAACGPATATVSPVQPVTVEATATLPSSPTLDTSAEMTAAPTETRLPTPLPIATSRGPNLEATDPTTVSMASGGLQFVEFFEFW
jgi:hypothetical protein